MVILIKNLIIKFPKKLLEQMSILFVGISSLKGRLLNSQKNLKSLNLIIEVGGSFDIYSGLITELL